MHFCSILYVLNIYLDHGEEQMTEGDVAAAEICHLDQIENVNNLLLTQSNQESN